MKKAKKTKAGKTKKAVKKASAKPKASKNSRSAKTSKQKEHAKSQLVTGSMTFSEVLEKYPDTAFIMLKYGLHCVGCHIASYETVEEGARAHGLDDKMVKKMIDDMNKVASSKKN